LLRARGVGLALAMSSWTTFFLRDLG
jgi:hypothetical protein